MNKISFLKKKHEGKISWIKQIDYSALLLILMVIGIIIFFVWIFSSAGVSYVVADQLCVQKYGEYSRMSDVRIDIVHGVARVKCEYIENDKLAYACYTNLKGKLIPFDCADKELGDF